MSPRAAVDVPQHYVPDGGTDDYVVAPIGRCSHLVVHPPADTGIVGNQVDPEDVKGLDILVEVIMTKNALHQELVDLVVIDRLISGRKAIAEHGDVLFGPRWSTPKDLGHAVRHAEHPPLAGG